MGILHGAVFCDIADAAMGIAYASALEKGEALATLELKINFLKSIGQAKLRAIGKVVHKGDTVGLLECNILDEEDCLIARASCTCMTLRATVAQGPATKPTSGALSSGAVS
ncbi:MAG: PaaI family thioesterase [Methylocella sp.]